MTPVFSITIELVNGKLVTWTQSKDKMDPKDWAKYEELKRVVKKIVQDCNVKQGDLYEKAGV